MLLHGDLSCSGLRQFFCAYVRRGMRHLEYVMVFVLVQEEELKKLQSEHKKLDQAREYLERALGAFSSRKFDPIFDKLKDEADSKVDSKPAEIESKQAEIKLAKKKRKEAKFKKTKAELKESLKLNLGVLKSKGALTGNMLEHVKVEELIYRSCVFRVYTYSKHVCCGCFTDQVDTRQSVCNIA